MNKVSLFSGIGGDDIASEWAGIETICFVENNKYCQQVLRKHWPDIPIIEDVKDVTKEKIMAYAESWQSRQSEARNRGQDISRRSETFGNPESNRSNQVRSLSEGKSTLPRGICFDGCGIDIISGGFPCQPHSVAGKREGSADERNLWPEFRRVIGEIKPRWVVAENVPGIFSSDAGRFFGTILTDLAEMGYSTGWTTFGAVDVGALHRRNRVFIVAHTGCISNNGGSSERREQEGSKSRYRATRPSKYASDVADTISQRLEVGEKPELLEQCTAIERSSIITNANNPTTTRQRKYSRQVYGKPESERFDIRNGEDWWAIEPNVGRVAHGIPSRVDRLKALGNAVVPQQIYPVYKAIAEIEKAMRYS